MKTVIKIAFMLVVFQFTLMPASVSAGETRDNLVKKLTPSQIEDGQRLAREWIATHQQTEQ